MGAAERKVSRGAHLVEGEHLTGHLAPIIQGDAHPEVDLLEPSVSSDRSSFSHSLGRRIGDRGHVRNRPI